MDIKGLKISSFFKFFCDLIFCPEVQFERIFNEFETNFHREIISPFFLYNWHKKQYIVFKYMPKKLSLAVSLAWDSFGPKFFVQLPNLKSLHVPLNSQVGEPT